jgi:membrane-associated phospholipid phosphatase
VQDIWQILFKIFKKINKYQFLRFPTLEMFPNTVENWISSMAVAYVAIPIFLFVAFQNVLALKITGIILTANGISALLKQLFQNSNKQFLKRPPGAEGCNIQMTEYQGGNPGFPSGHMATTTAFWTCVWVLVPIHYKQPTIWIGGVLSALMMWSRMKKSCHTALQCVAGALLGCFVAFVGVRYIL